MTSVQNILKKYLELLNKLKLKELILELKNRKNEKAKIVLLELSVRQCTMLLTGYAVAKLQLILCCICLIPKTNVSAWTTQTGNISMPN